MTEGQIPSSSILSIYDRRNLAVVRLNKPTPSASLGQTIAGLFKLSTAPWGQVGKAGALVSSFLPWSRPGFPSCPRAPPQAGTTSAQCQIPTSSARPRHHLGTRSHQLSSMLHDQLLSRRCERGRQEILVWPNRLWRVRYHLRQTSIASLLLCTLLYAWLGHDLQHHHRHHDGPQHHQHLSQDEASHTKAVHRGTNCCVAPPVMVALLVGFCDFALPQLVLFEDAPSPEVALLIEPQFWERPNCPRAPPLPFSVS